MTAPFPRLHARLRADAGIAFSLLLALVATLLMVTVSAPTANAVAAAPAAPPGVTNPCSGKDIFYIFRYNDSDAVGIDTGCSEKKEVTRSQVPGLVASSLHVSCSDKISADGVPTKSNLGSAGRRVASYYIEKDGGKKSCGFGNPAGPPTVDIGIKKTASETTVETGSKVTYTLRVSNNTSTGATGVVVSDSLPAGVTYVSSSEGCTYDGATRKVTCQVGTLAASGTPTNSCSGKDIFYRFEYNDSATVGVDTGCAAKNEVTRSQVPSLVASSLHVSCSDKISADGVPTKSNLGSPSRRVAAYYIDKDGGKKTCGQGTFSPPAPKTFTITVKVSTSHCNTATVTSTETDSNPADNSSTVCITVPVPASQQIKGEIYKCVSGAPSTTLVSGGTVAVPSRGLSSANPLPATDVPAGTYEMTATAPSGKRFVSCGQGGVTIDTPTNARQNVTVPSGGVGDGKFYVETVQYGYVEVCKSDANGVTGKFQFRVNGGSSFSVPAGGCSSAIRVESGNATIREVYRSGFSMVGATATPSSRLKSVDTTARDVTVTVVPGDVSTQTIVTVTNKPKSGLAKICQVAGAGVSEGTVFSYTNSANGDVTRVAAGPAPGGYCTVVGTFSGNLTLTQSASSTKVTKIDVQPADRAVSQDVTGRTNTMLIGGGVTEVTYTNSAN